MRLITLVVLLSATLQAAAATKVLKTEVYNFYDLSSDGLVSEDQAEPCWKFYNTSGGGSEYWNGYAVYLPVYYSDEAYLLSEVTFPDVVKKVIINVGCTAGIDSPGLSVNGDYQSISYVNLGTTYFNSSDPNLYDDYEFDNISTVDYNGRIRIDLNQANNTQYYIRSITVQYEADPDPEPYALLSDDNKTLTFYYNNEKLAESNRR